MRSRAAPGHNGLSSPNGASAPAAATAAKKMQVGWGRVVGGAAACGRDGFWDQGYKADGQDTLPAVPLCSSCAVPRVRASGAAAVAATPAHGHATPLPPTLQADWRVVLGEAAIDIRVGRYSQGLSSESQGEGTVRPGAVYRYMVWHLETRVRAPFGHLVRPPTCVVCPF